MPELLARYLFNPPKNKDKMKNDAKAPEICLKFYLKNPDFQANT